MKIISLCVFVILIVSGCAITPTHIIRMKMPVQEISQIEQTEGIIVGSVLIKVAKAREVDDSRWSFLRGKRTEDSEYPAFSILAEKYDDPTKEYIIHAEPDQEVVFVTKMPAGDYHFHRISKPIRSLSVRTDIPFTVHAGKKVYIGRLVIVLPARLSSTSRIILKVRDAKESTIASAREIYGNLAANVVKDLMWEKTGPIFH